MNQLNEQWFIKNGFKKEHDNYALRVLEDGSKNVRQFVGTKFPDNEWKVIYLVNLIEASQYWRSTEEIQEAFSFITGEFLKTDEINDMLED